MNISLGILAWNEAEVIAVSLRSLFEQSLFQRLENLDASVQVVVVPNGCTDATAGVAAEALTRCAAAMSADRLRWQVCELQEPGKANAWNQFVHEFADPGADYLFLMDADIRFTHPDTLLNMIRALEQNRDASVSTDLPQKHVLFKKRKSLFDHLSLAIGQMTQAATAQITGQLYCARGPVLRRIYLPPGLIADDGFIKVMVCTELLRSPSDDRRVVRAPDASHVFEAYTRFRDIFFNQRRQQVAHTIYVFLRDYLSAQTGTRDAGEIVRDNNADDPDWYRKLIRERVAGGGRWVIYPGAFGIRFRRLKKLPLPQRIRKLPATLVGFILDAMVLVAANAFLKSGKLKGIWKDTKTTQLGAASDGSATDGSF